MIPGWYRTRRTRRIGGVTAAVAAVALAGAMSGAIGTTANASGATRNDPAASCPWVHSHAPIAARVSELLGQMTLDDKIAVVDGVGFSTGTAGYVGQIAANPQLCIPGLNLEDGPQGVADNVPGVTQLPAPVALAAAWDPALAQAYGGVVGSEEHGKGATVNLGPTVNIVRDPRFGRAFETYGEDPYLSGQTAVGFIDGVQDQGVLSQVKHIAVYNQETNRNTSADNAIVSQRTMQEIYLPQFQAAVTQGKAASVMCSYSTINGQYACENSGLLTNVLDKQWHFPGFVTSDWGATHSTVPSALAGLDMQMPGGAGFGGPDYYGAPLKQAVQAGQVPMASLDQMVSRILTEMFRFGLFDRPPTGSLTAVVTTPEHAQVGQRVEDAATVLLKNDGRVLPLQPRRDKSVAVIGSDGGRYALTSGGGSAGVVAPYVVTPEQGITSRGAKSGVTVTYSQGDIPANGALDTVPASAFPQSLTASYYNNTTFSGSPTATGTVPSIALSWGGKPPATGINASGWSAKFTGIIDLPAAGKYALSLSFTGTASVTIGGHQVFASQTQFGGVTRATAQLPSGPASIEVDYADTIPFGNDGITLGWVPPADLLGQAVAAAKQASVAVVFASNFETEGADLATIDLPASENQLISAVAAANPNTVVVLNTGSAVTMPWLSQVKGVIEAWYPGQDDGNEIAAVLFGDVNPSGKLPVTFPASLAQVPASTPAQWPGVNGTVQYSEGLLVGYRWYTAKEITPLFPFGAGLSYTTFAFSDLRVRHAPDGGVTVTAEVTNTGHRAGADVAQLYVGDPASTGEPAEQLKAFQRVWLRPGETETVRFTLDRSAFAWWDNGWTVTPGSYALMVGDSSVSLPLTGHMEVTS